MRLGDTNAEVAEHCRGVEAEMRATMEIPDDVPVHSVFVAVYADGRLQFAGADTTTAKLDRSVAKDRAGVVLMRMDPRGELS